MVGSKTKLEFYYAVISVNGLYEGDSKAKQLTHWEMENGICANNV
jgi:hypothetical protein